MFDRLGLTGKCFKYAALGDSIAYGAGATQNYGYVNYFRDFLAGLYRCVDLTNIGFPCLTIADLVNKLKQDDKIRHEVKSADLLTISVGETILSHSCSSEIESFTNDWSIILNEIRKSIKSKANILVMTVYNPFQLDDSYSAIDMFIKQFNETIKNNKLRSKYGYIVVDVYSDFLGEFTDHRYKVSTWTNINGNPPNPYPTDTGHLEIARLHQLSYIKHLYSNDLPIRI